MNRFITKSYHLFFWTVIFSIAMGLLEAIVVVYIRALYYPDGFHFPLAMFPENLFSIELIREASTIVMLISIGIIAGKNSLQRFAYFLFCFGVWDIFYYTGLKLFLNWPPSFLTWDVLFLIPVTWLGPVLAPVINSITMILFAVILVYFQESSYQIKIKKYDWIMFIGGAFIIFCTYIWDFMVIIIDGGFLPNFFSLAKNERFLKIISNYKPEFFNWYLFSLGEILILTAIGSILKRTISKTQVEQF